MKILRIVLVVLLILIPIALRTAWFYQGIYQRGEPVRIPDYANIQEPGAPAAQPAATRAVDTSFSQKTAGTEKTSVLFDGVHANLFVLTELGPLVSAITSRSAQILVSQTGLSLAQQLKSANAYVVVSPAAPYAPEEISAVQKFVDHGGRLIVIADPTRDGGALTGGSSGPSMSPVRGVDAANLLLDPFGLAFASDYVYNLTQNEGNFRNVIFNNVIPTVITRDVKQVVFYSAHSLTKANRVLIRGDKNTLSSSTDTGGELVVAATDEESRVLALGDMTFLTEPYNRVAGNSALIDNIAGFLTSGLRVHELADYPYLFSRPAKFLISKDLSLDANSVEALGKFFDSLGITAGKLETTTEIGNGYDLLVAATYADAQGKSLVDLLKPFKLEYEKSEAGGGVPDGMRLTAMPTPGLPGKSTPDARKTPEESPKPAATPTLGFDFGSFGGGEKPIGWKGTITIPGFGKVDSKSIGLILFDAGPDRNMLVLLADSNASLSDLAGLLKSNRFDTCAMQSTLAVCSLSPAGGY